MAAQNHAREFARPERHNHAAAGLHAMLQSERERVGERLIERYGQADVAELMRQLSV